MIEQNLLLVLLLLPFLGSLLVASSPANIRHGEAWLSGLIAVAGLCVVAALYPHVADGGAVRTQIPWLRDTGLDFTLRLDGFAWIFASLIMGIGLLVVLYARYYLSPKDPAARFFSFLLSFMGAMTGIVVAGNLILLFIFWELTSVTSFLLIGYWHHAASARDGARTAMIVTVAGGQCLLAGLLLIGHIVGSYDLDVVLAAGDLIRGHDLYLPALILILLGVFTKSAQFPFHFWLPSAMAAPTPVSAYLHSATMVKAGIFLLIRLAPPLSGTDAWFWIVGGAGMVTLVLGALFALFQHDLKGLLAYSTISHLGLITALAGMGSPLAIVAAIFHLMNHAVFKASLFMAAGIVDHETGTRDLRRLNGLRGPMPITATLAIVASAAMAGVPLLNGFLSKEMFLAETIEMHDGSLLDRIMPWMALVGTTLSVAYSLRLIHDVFFGPPPSDLPREPHEPPHWMRFPVEFLVVICVLVGIMPSLVVRPFLDTAARAALGGTLPEYSLAIWHGFSEPLVMSMIAIAVGVLLYVLFMPRIMYGPEGPPVLRRLEGRRIFDRIMVTLSWRWARWFHRILGTESLQPQLRLLVLVSLGAAAATLAGASFVSRITVEGFDPAFALSWMVGGACAIGAAWQAKYHRFAALVLLGGAGLVTCATFAWLSAPDLAVTQLLVETITTVLLLLGLRWLPKRLEEIPEDATPRARFRRGRDLVIAVACGAGIAAIAFTVMTQPLDSAIAAYFLENAYAEGGGTNVVNVILVDFRAFDTLGEITVLAIVALTVFALLRRFRPAPESVEPTEQQRHQKALARAQSDVAEEMLRDYMYVPSVTMQWMFPAIIMLSAYLFLRGHDLPGGGFAGGVALAIAFLLQYIAANVRWIEDRLNVLPVRWMGIGLLVAAGTGMGSWLFGHPFLTAHAQYVRLPLIGDVPAATALLFDLGVFALVVGATVLIEIAIAHQSLRASRRREQEKEDEPVAEEAV